MIDDQLVIKEYLSHMIFDKRPSSRIQTSTPKYFSMNLATSRITYLGILVERAELEFGNLRNHPFLYVDVLYLQL